MAVVQTEIGDFVVEVTTSIEHARTAVVSRHPVEGRRSMADHISVQPRSVSVRGVVSASPLADGDAEDPGRLGRVWDQLGALLGQVVVLVTEREVYPRMAVTSLRLPQDADTGDAIAFDAVLEELQVVERQDVAIPPEAPPPQHRAAASSTVDRGTQTGTDAKPADAEKSRSILADLLGVGT